MSKLTRGSVGRSVGRPSIVAKSECEFRSAGLAMFRENDRWLADLSRDGPERDAALAELRGTLVRNLRKALANRPRVDDSVLEDAVQDSLVRILGRLDTFKGRSRFVTGATSIAIHQALGALRRRRWNDVSLEDALRDADFVPERAIDTSSGPAQEAERRGILEAMRDLIENRLTEKQRTALLAEMKGMPQDEIARCLGSNRNAVYKLTHDARKKLKKGLEEAGYTPEEVVALYWK